MSDARLDDSEPPAKPDRTLSDRDDRLGAKIAAGLSIHPRRRNRAAAKQMMKAALLIFYGHSVSVIVSSATLLPPEGATAQRDIGIRNHRPSGELFSSRRCLELIFRFWLRPTEDRKGQSFGMAVYARSPYGPPPSAPVPVVFSVTVFADGSGCLSVQSDR